MKVSSILVSVFFELTIESGHLLAYPIIDEVVVPAIG